MESTHKISNHYPNFYYWDRHAQINMEAALLYMNHDMHKQCLCLTARAIHSMCKACYLKTTGMLPHSGKLHQDEALGIVKRYFHLALDEELLLQAACFLAENYDEMISNKPSPLQIERLLHKVSRVLLRISTTLPTAP